MMYTDIPRAAREGETLDQAAARKRRLYECRREREFYSYYDSILSLYQEEPKLCDLNDPSSVRDHQAVSSPDKVLTALVQLVALKLQTRRSMIFFFDSDWAYVLAEATQSLSLLDDSSHQQGDQLWLGSTKIPRGFSVCEVTADLPIVNDGSNAGDEDTKSIAHIINNLSDDTRFCNRPYVKDGPKARFYAGVPITTPKGINIGALCALDDKPRDGLIPSDVHFLEQMAATVMSHLELVRARNDNQTSRGMTESLGAFIEGKSQSEEWWHGSSKRPPSKSRQTHATPAPPSTLPPTLSADSRRSATGESQPKSVNAEESTSRLAAAMKTTGSTMFPPTSEPLPVAIEAGKHPSEEQLGEGTSIEASRTEEQLQEDDLAAQIKLTTGRAAALIREALGADGVIFLDATIGSFGGLVSSSRQMSLEDTDTDVSRRSDVNESTSSKSQKESESFPPRPEHGNYSPVLGSSFSVRGQSCVNTASQSPQVAEKWLRSLLRQYPRGQIWHFNSDGDASDDESSDGGLSATSATESAPSDLDHSPTSKRARQKMRVRSKNAAIIQKAFPGVRSFLFLGMWESHRDRWFGGSIVISYAPTRIFSVSTELTYLAAFCDVILADIWRLEALIVSRSKNDFISSISHELRSPLHGILGSAELMEDQGNGVLNRELIDSITSCGTTLLDIINDLLLYSRLNTKSQRQREQPNFLDVPTQRRSSKASIQQEKGSAEADHSPRLDLTAEAAVAASALGFNHQGTAVKGLPGQPPVTLSLAIENPLNRDWSFVIDQGSWKRMIMNLVSNALKYTPSGHVSVTLSKQWLPRMSTKEGIVNKAMICLKVEDTGIGMSKAFQAQNLFKPFQQEDTLVRGTGLGLNLVAQVVKSLGGKLDVQSKKGSGTSVNLLLPLRSACSSPALDESTTSLRDMSHSTSAVFIGFDQAQPDVASSQSRPEGLVKLSESLQSYCTLFGLQCLDPGEINHNVGSTTLCIVYEDTFREWLTEEGSREKCDNAIVVCSSRASALEFRSSIPKSEKLRNAQYLWLPIGPAKLAAAVRSCFTSAPQDNPGSESTALPAVAGAPRDPAPTYISENSRAMSLPERSRDPAAIRDIPMHTLQSELSRRLTDDPIDGISALTPQAENSTIPPVTRPSMSTLGRAVTTPVINNNTKEVKSISLLLVDDNRVNLRLLSVWAKKTGHPYRTAINGEEAVQIYQDAAGEPPLPSKPTVSKSAQEIPNDPEQLLPLIPIPDVILMDINMPLMNGFEAARHIRQFERERHLKRATIIAITGLGDESAQDEAFQSGMNLFLTKPVKLKELGAMIQGTDG